MGVCGRHKNSMESKAIRKKSVGGLNRVLKTLGRDLDCSSSGCLICSSMWCLVLCPAIKHSEPLFFTLIFTENNTKLDRKWGLAHIQLLTWRLKSALWIYCDGIHSLPMGPASFWASHSSYIVTTLRPWPDLHGNRSWEDNSFLRVYFHEITSRLPFILLCALTGGESKDPWPSPASVGCASTILSSPWGSGRVCSHELLLLLAKYFSQL